MNNTNYYHFTASFDCRACFDNLLFGLLNDKPLAQANTSLFWRLNGETYDIIVPTEQSIEFLNEIMTKIISEFNVLPAAESEKVIVTTSTISEAQFLATKAEYKEYTKSLF